MQRACKGERRKRLEACSVTELWLFTRDPVSPPQGTDQLTGGAWPSHHTDTTDSLVASTNAMTAPALLADSVSRQ